MGEKQNIAEEQLRRQLRDLEQGQQDFEVYTRTTLQEESEEDEKARCNYLELEHMRETCFEDRELLQLIDEKQDILNGIRKRRMEFIEELQQEVKKKNRKADMDMEDIYRQIQLLQEEEENDGL